MYVCVCMFSGQYGYLGACQRQRVANCFEMKKSVRTKKENSADRKLYYFDSFDASMISISIYVCTLNAELACSRVF